MSATSHGLVSGLIFGLVLVLLIQQLGALSLSELVPALEYLIAGAVVGAFLGAMIGTALGRRYLRRHAPPVQAWQPNP